MSGCCAMLPSVHTHVTDRHRSVTHPASQLTLMSVQIYSHFGRSLTFHQSVVSMSCRSVIDIELLLTGDYEGALARLTEMAYLLQEHVSLLSSASGQHVM